MNKNYYNYLDEYGANAVMRKIGCIMEDNESNKTLYEMCTGKKPSKKRKKKEENCCG